MSPASSSTGTGSDAPATAGRSAVTPGGAAGPPVEQPDGGLGAPEATPLHDRPELTGYRAVLANPHFLLIWLAQLFSQSAQNVVNYALVVEVERLTQSSTNVGWVVVAFSLPVLLLGPSAGVFVDRVGKRGVLFWTNVLRGLIMAAFLLSPQSLVAIYTVTFAASIISQFFAPAEGALLPLLVRRRHLITATSLFNLTYTGAQISGFILVGPTLYKLIGPMALYVAVIVMYGLAAICCALLPSRETHPAGVRQAIARALRLDHVWGDMREARRFLQDTPGVTVAMIHLALATALLMTLATLGPGFVNRVLGLGPADAGYVLAPAGLGMLLTTALIGHFGVQADRVRLAGRGLIGMGLSLAALGLVRPGFEHFATGLASGGPGAIPIAGTIVYLGLVCLITLSLGIEFSCITIPAQTMIAEATDPSLRGRVFALLFMVTGSVSTIPALVIGVLADAIGIVPMLVGLGTAVAIAGLASLRTGQPAGVASVD